MDHGHATSHELVSDHPFCLINANRNEKFNREATIVLILAGYSFWTMGLAGQEIALGVQLLQSKICPKPTPKTPVSARVRETQL